MWSLARDSTAHHIRYEVCDRAGKLLTVAAVMFGFVSGTFVLSVLEGGSSFCATSVLTLQLKKINTSIPVTTASWFKQL